MKNKITVPIILLLAAGFLLSACTGGATATSWPGLSSNADMAFLASGMQVYGVRLTDGSQAWKYPEDPNAKRTFYAAPILTDDGQLLVSGFDNQLVSLNAQSGQVNWSFTTGSRLIGSALVEDDVIYLPSADSTLYTLDLRGNPGWKFKTGNSLWAKPVADEDAVYFTSMDHSLYSVSKANGAQNWVTPLGAASVSTPALSETGLLYTGTMGNEMIAVDSASGRVAWRTATDGAVWSGPAVTPDALYFGDLSGKFYALNPDTGAILWTAQPDAAIVGTPTLTENYLVFGTESGSLVALDYKGSQVWRREIGGKLYTPPLQVGGRYLAAITQGENLLAYLDENGNQVWGFVPAK